MELFLTACFLFRGWWLSMLLHVLFPSYLLLPVQYFRVFSVGCYSFFYLFIEIHNLSNLDIGGIF